MAQPTTAPPRRNLLGIASLVAATLLLLASIAGQLLYPLVPFLANELGMSYQTLPMLVSIPSALLATIATALGIAGLLLRDRARTAAIIGTTLGASHLALGLVGVLGVHLAGALLR